MKKGTEPAYSVNRTAYTMSKDLGMSIRLKIASDAMCAILNSTTSKNDESIVKEALNITDLLIKMEEETRNET